MTLPPTTEACGTRDCSTLPSPETFPHHERRTHAGEPSCGAFRSTESGHGWSGWHARTGGQVPVQRRTYFLLAATRRAYQRQLLWIRTLWTTRRDRDHRRRPLGRIAQYDDNR